MVPVIYRGPVIGERRVTLNVLNYLRQSPTSQIPAKSR